MVDGLLLSSLSLSTFTFLPAFSHLLVSMFPHLPLYKIPALYLTMGLKLQYKFQRKETISNHSTHMRFQIHQSLLERISFWVQISSSS